MEGAAPQAKTRSHGSSKKLWFLIRVFVFSWIYYNCYMFPVKTLFSASCYVIDFFFRSISANSIGLLLPVQSSTGIKNVFSSVVVSFFFLLCFLVNLLGNKIAFKLTWKGIFRSVLKFWYSPTAEWRIIWRKIIAVIYATYAVAKRKPEKNSGLYGIRTLDLELRSSLI